jgi:hypothetical protein
MVLAAADLYRCHRHISTKQSALVSSRGCRKLSLSLVYVILGYFLPEIPKQSVGFHVSKNTGTKKQTGRADTTTPPDSSPVISAIYQLHQY